MWRVIFELKNGIKKEIGIFDSEMIAWEQAFRFKMNWSVKNMYVVPV